MANITISSDNQVIYYDKIYEVRLAWTNHGIPISFRDPRSSFIVEGWIYVLPRRIVGKSTFKVKVEYAFDTPRLNSVVSVNVFDIYPSRRKMTRLDGPNVIETTIVPPGDVPLLIKSPLDFSKIKDIYDSYYGVNWTAAELCSMLDRQGEEEKVKVLPFLKPAAERICRITNEMSITYSFETPEPLKVDGARNLWSLDKIKEDYTNCTKCVLGLKRKNRGCSIVPGRGSVEPKLFIIGEAPGMQEEEHGIPFYPEAPAGQILDKVLKACNIPVRDCYITNSVLCRPEPDTGSSVQNGKPEQEHIAACSSRLKLELLVTNAKVIVLLGSYAYKAFFGTSVKGTIEKNIGWQPQVKGDYKVYLTYHPSFIIRQIDFEQDPGKVAEIKASYKANFAEIRRVAYE